MDLDREKTAKELVLEGLARPSSGGLVKLDSNTTRWVPSRFNARATTPDGVLVLYNSYTGAVSGFPPQYAEKVCELLASEGFVAGLDLDGLRGYLEKRGFLIREGVDEFQRFRYQFASQHHRADKLELILLTSEECNFRCKYCYESFPRGTMEPWVREGVIKLLEARAPRLNRLKISYFGGEPLLGLEAIDEVAPAALRIATMNDINYSATMTTNGYLLTPDVFDRLVNWNIRSYQITLDGEKECHDHNRPLKDGGGTFDTILDNLRRMRSTDHQFSVTIRVNFDPQNIQSMPRFLESISEFKGDHRFDLRFFGIGKWGGPNDASLETCGIDSENQKRQLDVLASDLGFQSEGRLPYVAPTAKGSVCYAARPFNLIVGADGKLMKCTVVLDTKDHNIVGRLTADGAAQIQIDKLVKWTAPYFEDDEMCKQCFFLPVCQGVSCPLPRLETGDRPCPSQKLQIQSTLTGIWQQKRGTGRVYSVEQQRFLGDEGPVEPPGGGHSQMSRQVDATIGSQERS